MADSILSVPILFILLVHFSSSGGLLQFADGSVATDSENGNGVTWCVAKPSSSDGELSANINFACNQIQDCSQIKEHGSCYYPNTLINHASVVMNLYYQSMGKNYWNCHFSNSGVIAISDPSYGNCKYTS